VLGLMRIRSGCLSFFQNSPMSLPLLRMITSRGKPPGRGVIWDCVRSSAGEGADDCARAPIPGERRIAPIPAMSNALRFKVRNPMQESDGPDPKPHIPVTRHRRRATYGNLGKIGERSPAVLNHTMNGGPYPTTATTTRACSSRIVEHARGKLPSTVALTGPGRNHQPGLVRLLSGPSIGGLSLRSRFDFILVQKRLPRVVTLFIRVFGIIALIVATGDVLQIVQRELAHGQ